MCAILQHMLGELLGLCAHVCVCVCVCVCPSYSSDEAVRGPVPIVPICTTFHLCVHTGLLVLVSYTKARARVCVWWMCIRKLCVVDV